MSVSSGTRNVLRVLLTLGLPVTAFLPVPRAAVAAGTGVWKQQAPPGIPAGLPPFIQIQCPNPTVCYALANPRNFAGTHPVLDVTRDGGATWTVRQLSVDAYQSSRAQPLSCPSVNTCYLLAGTGNVTQPRISLRITTDGGKTWRDRGTLISCAAVTCDSPLALACPSTAVCYAIVWSLNGPPSEGALLVTRNGGASWSKQTLAEDSSDPLAVRPLACPGINDCYLGGARVVRGSGRAGTGKPRIEVTHDGGRTWTARYPGAYLSLSCPAARQCYAAGDRGRLAVTTDGGKTWKQRSLPVTDTYATDQPIACPTATTCYTIEPPRDNTPLWSTTDSGVTWKPGPSDISYAVMALACPGTTTCYAVGYTGEVVKTTDGRSWWNPTPYTRHSLNAIACPSAGACYVVGQAGTVLTTGDAGATWTRRSSGTSANLGSIACLDPRTCLASGSLPGVGGVLLRTSDGGQTWQVQNEDKTMSVGSVACPSRTVCFATGAVTRGAKSLASAAILRSEDGGRTWAARALPRTDGLESYTQSVACGTTQRCVAAGGVTPCNDVVLQRSDTAPLQPKQDAGCTPRGWLFGTTDGGAHWRREIKVMGGPNTEEGGTLLSVSCPSAAQCYAAGYAIWARSTGGSAWDVTVPDKFAGQQWIAVHSLSCPGSSTCWGLASNGNDPAGIPILTTDGGKSWRQVAQNVPVPDQGNLAGLLTLACPEVNRCFGAGYGGLIMGYSE